ncbi:hypothetical protein MMC29_001495 [Sticta canariensis]|nr:hypothetical protein [Sticta canariensis]
MSTFPIDDNLFDDTELDDEQEPDNEVVDPELDGEQEPDIEVVDLELDGEQKPDNEAVDPELDCEHELDGEFEYVVPEDENLDNHDASWKEINIPPIDSSMILEADQEPISLAEPIEGDSQGLEELFLPFLFCFFSRALRRNIDITV